jgi:hypothetical protein
MLETLKLPLKSATVHIEQRLAPDHGNGLRRRGFALHNEDFDNLTFFFQTTIQHVKGCEQ